MAGAICACHFFMPRILPFVLSFLTFVVTTSFAQAPETKPLAEPLASATRAAVLAESGQCPQALPLLQKSIARSLAPGLKRRVGFAGLHCAMILNQQDKAIDFVQMLNREFPRDPEVLYVSAHAYSDLSIRTSQELIHTAPASYQVHELNAEALETQARMAEALLLAGQSSEATDIVDRTLRDVEELGGLAVLRAMLYRLRGCALVSEGFHKEIPKGYIYFAMVFSVGVESLNLRLRKKQSAQVQLHQPYR